MKLNNKGQSLVLFICILPIILMIVLLVYDMGQLSSEKEKLNSINKIAIKYLKENNTTEEYLIKAENLIKKNDSSIEIIKLENLNNKVTISLNKEVLSTLGKLIKIFKYDIKSTYELENNKIKRIK